MFENCKTNTDKGNIGESYAVYVLTSLGYTVSRPVFNNTVYDLIVDNGTQLFKVQVKTTTNKKPSGVYEVGLRTTGRKHESHFAKHREDGDYDYLFTMTDSGNDWWMIPESRLGKNSINLNESVDMYKNNF